MARLRRACARHRLKPPNEYDQEGLDEEIEATHVKLQELEKVAPKLRKKFLLLLQEWADQRGDSKKARQIGEMITREAQRKTWRRINWTTKKE